jgi:CRISPR/Cas system Type II protein with McrA/HNH and RuvC-like nuclease domain
MAKRGRKKKRRLFDEQGYEVKVCTRCNQTYRLDMFTTNPSWCNECMKNYLREYQAKKTTIDDKAKERAKSAFNRASEKGIECMTEKELEKEIRRMYFLQGGTCLYSGLRMELNSNDKKYSVSVDRYRSGASEDGAYHSHNLVLTCSIINRMKQDLSYKEFLFLCRKVVNHYEKLKAEQGIDLCDF